MYRYYNANALNKYEDDCVIRAISCATNKSWDYVYDYLSDIAQYEGTLLDKREFVRNYSKNGVIYDTFDCRDREVEDVWLVS